MPVTYVVSVMIPIDIIGCETIKYSQWKNTDTFFISLSVVIFFIQFFYF